MAGSNTVRVVTTIVAAICGAAWQTAPHEGRAAPNAAVAASKPAKHFTSKQRLDAIRRAQVWTATNVSEMDMKVGPQGKRRFVAGATIACDYAKHELGGSTPKFWCTVAPDDLVKVRYGDHNGEVYGRVAAARLLWALGFGADRDYPVKVACKGCPWEPFTSRALEAGQPDTILFDPATIDLKMDGKTLETRIDEGWAWKDLDLVEEAAGGAPLAHRDALKLLAVLIQHTDSKAANQRLLCLDKHDAAAGADDPAEDSCAHPFMMIADVGVTFGRANKFNQDAAGSVNFKNWSHMPVWKDADRPGCVGNLPGSAGGTFDNPRISEAGRKFLADLLVQLSDAQLRDLFNVARFSRRDPTASIDDWVAAFKQKRDDIVNRSCGS